MLTIHLKQTKLTSKLKRPGRRDYLEETAIELTQKSVELTACEPLSASGKKALKTYRCVAFAPFLQIMSGKNETIFPMPTTQKSDMGQARLENAGIVGGGT
jgi:hypothetical protein